MNDLSTSLYRGISGVFPSIRKGSYKMNDISGAILKTADGFSKDETCIAAGIL